MSAGGPGGGCSATMTDFPLTQVLLAVSHLASRRVVLVLGDTPRSGPDRSDSLVAVGLPRWSPED